MSVASLNALVLTLTEEKATLEFQRTIYDQRRQTLAFERAELSSQWTAKMQMKYVMENDKDANPTDTIDEINWDQFQLEYSAAQARLDAQDKILEMERNNIDTKIEAVSTSLESVSKQLNKNVESDFKSNN